VKPIARTAFVMAFLIAGQSLAQTSKPALDSTRARLQFLVGSFTTETTMPARPPAATGAIGKGTTIISWALDSMFLIIEEQSMNTLLGQYKGHGVLGFDARTHQYALSMFNNFGDRPTYRGAFVGDTLVLATTIPMPGRSFDQKLVWYKEGDTVTLKVLNDLGKGFALALEQKANPAPRK
jgi:hypothetical protein